VADLQTEVGEAADKCHHATLDMYAHTTRLRFVVGDGSDVVTAHEGLAAAMRGWFDETKTGRVENRSDDAKAQGEKKLNACNSAGRKFESAM
jgi:hypothetical protein